MQIYNEDWEKQCQRFRLGWVICMLKSIILHPFVFLMWFTQKEVRIHIQWGKVDLVRFFASFLKRNSCLKIRRFVDKRHACFPPQSQKEIKKTWKAQQMCISFAFFFNLFVSTSCVASRLSLKANQLPFQANRPASPSSIPNEPWSKAVRPRHVSKTHLFSTFQWELPF